jgi:hypothetical protein
MSRPHRCGFAGELGGKPHSLVARSSPRERWKGRFDSAGLRNETAAVHLHPLSRSVFGVPHGPRADWKGFAADMQLGAAIRRRIEQLGPWPSLVLLAVPVCIVEPLKLVGLAVAGEGHWIGGAAVAIAAYAASLLLVERLFHIVKPKLLALPWFAKFWCFVTAMRDRVWRWWTGGPRS